MAGQPWTAGHPRTAGDQHRARQQETAARPVWQGQDHLADMASLADEPESLRSTPHIPGLSGVAGATHRIRTTRPTRPASAEICCGSASIRSNARYRTLWCASATASASRRSVLPISRKRPSGANNRSEASTNSPASELSTTSTPRPPVADKNFPSKSSVRESAIWSSSNPIARNVSHLPRLAVAKTSKPQCRASCTAAIPTPPAAACTSTDSPARTRAKADKP